MKALFIGRFQPFHKGHLQIIKNLCKKYDHIIIGIGSSQYSHTIDNPFSYKERHTMINDTLHKNNIKNFSIMEIPDIHDPPNWVAHVIQQVPNFDIVISNNKFTSELFKKKGMRVEKTQVIDRSKYSGKIIRQRILQHQPWEHLVPEPIAKKIKKYNGEKRLQAINTSS